MGLLTEVVPAGEHLARALEMAEGLARFPQETMLADRRAALEGFGLPLADGLALEAQAGPAVFADAVAGAARFAGGEGRGGAGDRRIGLPFPREETRFELLRHRRHRLHRPPSRAGAAAQPRGRDLRARARGLAGAPGAARPRAGRAASASRPSSATSRRSASASSRAGSTSTAATIDHFFHLAAVYDMTADDEDNERANVTGTRNAVALANALEAGILHHASSVAVAGSYKGLFREDMFDEGQKLPSSYHQTKFESEKIAREESSVPWRVYRPVGRHRPLEDRRDGQDRRALLLLQGDPEGAPRAARVVPAGRPRVRLHEHRAGRLRGRGDGPHRPPARPRRAGLPPHGAQVAALGRGAQHLRQGRARAAAWRSASTSA